LFTASQIWLWLLSVWASAATAGNAVIFAGGALNPDPVINTAVRPRAARQAKGLLSAAMRFGWSRANKRSHVSTSNWSSASCANPIAASKLAYDLALELISSSGLLVGARTTKWPWDATSCPQ